MRGRKDSCVICDNVELSLYVAAQHARNIELASIVRMANMRFKQTLSYACYHKHFHNHVRKPPVANVIPLKEFELADEQREEIRELLSVSFVKGAFIEGESDETIAKAINVPVSCVTMVREAAFGKIKKIDPLPEQLGELRKQTVALASNLDQLHRTIVKETNDKITRMREDIIGEFASSIESVRLEIAKLASKINDLDPSFKKQKAS